MIAVIGTQEKQSNSIESGWTEIVDENKTLICDWKARGMCFNACLTVEILWRLDVPKCNLQMHTVP